VDHRAFFSLLLDFSLRQRQPAGLPGAVRSLIVACWTGQMQTRPKQ
jgi:hypothetical protein